MISKPLFLPSSGLEYSPYIKLQPLTKEAELFMHNQRNYNSIFELWFSIINKYIELPQINLEEMFLQDFHYIWKYISIDDLKNEENVAIDQCKFCKKYTEKKYSIDELMLYEYNIYDQKPQTIKTIQFKQDYEISFRKRKVKDNFYLTYFSNQTNVYQAVHHLIPQIIDIKYKNESLPSYLYVDVLSSFLINELTTLEKIFKNFEEFGFQLYIDTQCQYCKKEIQIETNNDYVATLVPKENNQKEQSIIDSYKTVLELARFPVGNFSILNRMKLNEEKYFYEAMYNINYSSGSIIN